jgi:hypothetical protein
MVAIAVIPGIAFLAYVLLLAPSPLYVQRSSLADDIYLAFFGQIEPSIQFAGAIIIFYIIGRAYTKKKRYLAILSLLLTGSSFVLLLVVNDGLKYLCRIDRPETAVEHTISRMYMSGEIGAEQMADVIDVSAMHCPVSERLAQMIVYKGGGRVSASDMTRELANNKSLARHLNVVQGGGTVFPAFRSSDEVVKVNREIKTWRGRIKVRDIALVKTANNEESATCKADSCPSGHALRQAVIFILSIALIRRNFRKIGSAWTILLVAVNVLCLFIVLYYRVYSFKHTLFDVGVSLVIAPIFLFVAVRAANAGLRVTNALFRNRLIKSPIGGQ